MIYSNLFLVLAQTYVKLLDNDVIAKGYKIDYKQIFYFSLKCQTIVNFQTTLKKVFDLGSLRTFPVIVSNSCPRISSKMSFTIEDKALIY
jgi:hypothetical protein